MNSLFDIYKKYGKQIPCYVLIRGPWSKFLTDRCYLRLKYKLLIGNDLNIDDPESFNEKMQWLKLNDRKGVYSIMADKFRVKEYVSKLVGKKYIIPLLGVWKKFDDIDFNILPDKFVLKTTHDSGGVVICRNKETFDIDLARKKLNKSLHNNYYWSGREWPYKNIEPQIIAEKYMQNGTDENLVVYKIFNFNGNPEIIQVIQDDKQDSETIDYFDVEWNLLTLQQNFPNSVVHIEKPQKLKKMLSIAKTLSAGFAFLRTDFFIINNEVFFSEFTFYSDSGFATFVPKEWDEILGEKIVLPNKKSNMY